MCVCVCIFSVKEDNSIQSLKLSPQFFTHSEQHSRKIIRTPTQKIKFK